jgi:hypothetical protein
MRSPSKTAPNDSTNPEQNSQTIDFIEQVRVNQKQLRRTETTLRLHRLRVRFIGVGGGAPVG